MEFNNEHSGGNLLLSLALTAGVLLSKFLHFSFSATLTMLLDIDWGAAAKVVDGVFHYGLVLITLAFTSEKYYDYRKNKRNKKKNEEE